MAALEVVLLVTGVLCIVVSFLFNDKEEKEKTDTEKSVDLTSQQKEEIKKQVDQIVKAQLDDVHEKTEASLDKISNTKILEMNDYAETIMGEINRNHNETVFLYDMLNEKAKEVKNTVKDVNMAKRQVDKIRSQVITQPADSEDNAELQATTLEERRALNTVRDDAKERLSALVRQSNEKKRNKEESLTHGHQANELDQMVKENKMNTKQQSHKQEQVAKYTQNDQDYEYGNFDTMSESISETISEPVTLSQTEALLDSINLNTMIPEQAGMATNVLNATKLTNDTKAMEPTADAKLDTVKSDDFGTMSIQSENSSNHNERILKLHDSGMNNKDIAKELGIGIGEVKLVIDLFNRSKRSE